MPAFALNELKDVGIAKYAVLEVLKDNTPIRKKADEYGDTRAKKRNVF